MKERKRMSVEGRKKVNRRGREGRSRCEGGKQPKRGGEG